MDAQRRTRSCSRERLPQTEGTPRGSRQICIPMTRETYDRIWNDAGEVRRFLQSLIENSPELFPGGIGDGFQLTGRLPESGKMPGIRLRQLRLRDGTTFTLRPSFVMSYMSGTVEDLEHPLLLLSFGVPCWLVTRIFGRNDMYWHRHLERLGRNSLVGTTVRDPSRLPEHLTADEHHGDWRGQKAYVPMTAGEGCILGLALTDSADEAHLTDAYGQFAQEARAVKPDYAPKTVNTDGWFATRNAFGTLFSRIVTILCFLHGFLKIRDRCRQARELHDRVWEVYHAASAVEFRERMAAFRTWFEQGTWPKAVQEMVTKLWNRESEYVLAYSHPDCHRTSNMVDRLMNRLTRFLYAGRGLHGHRISSERRLRGWALLQNFRPFAPRSGQTRQYQSPAHRLSRNQYHPHWLHNLQVCASLAGATSPHRKR
jgi:hypothetical protein